MIVFPLVIKEEIRPMSFQYFSYLFIATVHSLLFPLYLFTDARKDKAHGHMNIWILLALVLIILLGMGFMIYFLFKIKTQSGTEEEVKWHNTLIEYSRVLRGRDSGNDSTNKEKNEHSDV